MKLRSVLGMIARSFEFVRSYADKIKYLPGAIFDFRVELIMFRGTLRDQDGQVNLLYVGRGPNLAYLKKSIFPGSEVVKTQKTTLFSFRSQIADWEQNADIVFADIGWPYTFLLNKSGEYLEMPDWISMVVPIEKDWATIEQRFNKTTRKQIRRLDYTFEATNDPDVIARFYDEFYVPFVSLRHDGDVILDSRKAVEGRARQGKILRVLDGDDPIVAGVIYFQDDVLYFLWVGMAEKHLDNPPPAAIMSIYYYCLRYAFENGFKAANWLGTRGFPTDGVFQFKRRWGAGVLDDFSPSSILIKPASNSAMAAKFLESLPLLTRKDGKIEQIFCTTAATCGEKDINRMLAGFSCVGIDHVKIVHVVEGDVETGTYSPPQHPNVTVKATHLNKLTDSVLRI